MSNALSLISKVTLLTLSTLLINQANAATLSQQQKNEQFIKLIEQAEKNIQKNIPTWQVEDTISYTADGEESLDDLIEKLSGLNKISDICTYNLGSKNLCTNGAKINFESGSEGVVGELNLNLNDFKGNSFNDLIKNSLTNSSNFRQNENKAILKVDNISEYTANFNSVSQHNIFDVAHDSLLALGLSSLIEDENSGGQALGVSKYLTLEQSTALLQTFSKITTETMKYEYERTKHCTISNSTHQKLLDLTYGSSLTEFNEFWLSDQETRQYSACIENAIGENGFNNSLLIAIELLKTAVEITDENLLKKDLISDITGNDPEAKQLFEGVIKLIPHLYSYRNRFNLGVVRDQDSGLLLLNAKLPRFSINDVNCADNISYCTDYIDSSFASSTSHHSQQSTIDKATLGALTGAVAGASIAKATSHNEVYIPPVRPQINNQYLSSSYSDSIPVKPVQTPNEQVVNCKLANYEYQGNTCRIVAMIVVSPSILNQTILSGDSAGIDMYYWMLNSVAEGKETAFGEDIDSIITAVHSTLKNAEQMSSSGLPSDEMILTFKQQTKQTFFSQKDVWVVDAIRFKEHN